MIITKTLTLYKSQMHKLDRDPVTRKRLARFLREQRLARKSVLRARSAFTQPTKTNG